jgi:hypothetical protein
MEHANGWIFTGEISDYLAKLNSQIDGFYIFLRAVKFIRNGCIFSNINEYQS